MSRRERAVQLLHLKVPLATPFFSETSPSADIKCHQHGTICWLEIPVLSASRAAVFYTTVFGWDCSIPSNSLNKTSSSSSTWPSPMNGGAATIHTFHKHGHGISTLRGAFIPVPEGCLIRACEAHTGEMAVLTTFAVESIEDTLRKVVEMGGQMHSYVTMIWSSNVSSHISRSQQTKPYLS